MIILWKNDFLWNGSLFMTLLFSVGQACKSDRKASCSQLADIWVFSKDVATTAIILPSPLGRPLAVSSWLVSFLFVPHLSLLLSCFPLFCLFLPLPHSLLSGFSWCQWVVFGIATSGVVCSQLWYWWSLPCVVLLIRCVSIWFIAL